MTQNEWHELMQMVKERCDAERMTAQMFWIEVTDDLFAGLMLDQIVFWSNPAIKKARGDWVYLTQKDHWDRYRMTKYNVARGRRKLMSMDVIEDRLMSMPKRLHYRLKMAQLLHCAGSSLQLSGSGQDNLSGDVENSATWAENSSNLSENSTPLSCKQHTNCLDPAQYSYNSSISSLSVPTDKDKEEILKREIVVAPGGRTPTLQNRGGEKRRSPEKIEADRRYAMLLRMHAIDRLRYAGKEVTDENIWDEVIRQNETNERFSTDTHDWRRYGTLG